MRLRLLSARDIDAALPMVEAVEVITRAYESVSRQEAVMPQRLAVQTPRGVSLFMPAYLASEGALAVKAVSVFGGNPQRGLPVIHALVLVLESETGRPKALLDGTRLTALRTGAAAGAATKLLARPESRVMALFGAGAQAFDQAAAVLAVRPIQEIRIYDPARRPAETMAERLKAAFPGLRAGRADSPAAAARGADVISCATTSRTPVFDPADAAPGCHINGVGSYTPDMKEVPVAGLKKAHFFVDQREAVLAEAGELIEAVDLGLIKKDDLVEIGLVSAGLAPGRRSEEEITFFKSVGLAAQDAAASAAVLARAEATDMGTMIDL
ncbi:MAG: ornithine cyclodeaminase family protein [Thermodesulfobacteriota bacterium]